jgi:hypothetical protein
MHADVVAGSVEVQLARRRVATVLIGSGWTTAVDGLRIWHDQHDGGVAMIIAADSLDQLGIGHTLRMAVPPYTSGSPRRAVDVDEPRGVEIHIPPDQFDRLTHWFPSIGQYIEDTTQRRNP